jgi:hypothetical protein
MNRYGYKMIFKFLILVLLFFSWRIDSGQSQEIQSKEKIISRFAGRVPKEWAEDVRGVKTRLDTNQKVLALTFDWS